MIIRNIPCVKNLMISEGSCDSEVWSNDAENSALHHRKKIKENIFK